MNYITKPIYKYFTIFCLIVLFILHQKKNIPFHNIIIIANIIIFFIIINDFIFIKNHPHILKQVQNKHNTKQNDYIDNLIEIVIKE